MTKANSDFTSHSTNESNPHGVTKAQIGLGNVDNTADSKKSVKYATSAGVTEKLPSWKLIKQVTGSTQVSFSNYMTSGYTELLAVVTHGLLQEQLVFSIPASGIEKYMTLPGYYLNASENLTESLHIANNKVNVSTFVYNGNNVLSEVSLGLYVR